ncbi:MAG TPA: PASTA domain-containing protein [Acetobacteraceae bacterium]|nr:PASTA domain-containing protein [Acetobacteraceae bacterium]
MLMQTGKSFKIKPEGPLATVAAWIASVYLICALGFLLWLLFDTWTGRNLLLNYWGYDKAILASSSFRLMAYVAIGGALGGAVDGIRSIISWHAERGVYGSRFVWKDFSLPLIGAAVGLIVYATVRSGAGIFSGDFSLDHAGSTPALSAFAVASLSGFSCLQVFRWLDGQANKLFRVTRTGDTIAPNLLGKTLDDAKEELEAPNLIVGAIDHEANDANIDKVFKQSPASGSVMRGGEAVNVTVGSRPSVQERLHWPRPEPQVPSAQK